MKAGFDARFRRALDFVMKWETVFDAQGRPIAEHDPDDAGGLTKFGIDQRSHPDVDVSRLSKTAAAGIYHREYWLAVRANELPVPLGEVLFDIAVNNGKSRAAHWLQEALGVKADGIIGPITLATAWKVDPTTVALLLIARRATFYRRIARGPKTKFLAGWMNRNRALTAFAAGLPQVWPVD